MKRTSLPLQRRDFITLLGGAAAWPLAARAQQATRGRRIVAMLSYREADAEGQSGLALFRKTLQEAGWVDGRNIELIVRWLPPPGSADQEAGEIVGLSPDVVLANTTRLLLSLTKATQSTPTVFNSVSDPLEQGIVSSLARPGGNITGFSNPPFSVAGKALQMITEIAPQVARVALIINAGNGAALGYSKILGSIAASLSITPVQATFRTPRDLEIDDRGVRTRAERRLVRAARHLRGRKPRIDR